MNAQILGCPNVAAQNPHLLFQLLTSELVFSRHTESHSYVPPCSGFHTSLSSLSSRPNWEEMAKNRSWANSGQLSQWLSAQWLLVGTPSSINSERALPSLPPQILAAYNSSRVHTQENLDSTQWYLLQNIHWARRKLYPKLNFDWCYRSLLQN